MITLEGTVGRGLRLMVRRKYSRRMGEVEMEGLKAKRREVQAEVPSLWEA